MIRVLLVEDSQEKISLISQAILLENNRHEISITMNVADAKRELQRKHFDLLVLDINLPRQPTGLPEKDAGLEVLRWLRTRGRGYQPNYIVGVTSYDDAYANAASQFDNLIWTIVKIKSDDHSWRTQLTNSIRDISASIRPPYVGDGSTYKTDILVVTALQAPELDAVLSINDSFEKIDVSHDASLYYKGRIVKDRKAASVVAVASSDKGLAGAAIAATKAIITFWPRYVYMTGITAGVKGRTSIGDVIFADLSWDWGSGKLKKVKGQEVFFPAPYQRRLDESLSRAAKELSFDSEFLQKVHNNWKGKSIERAPKILVGAMASGASVLQSNAAVKRVIDQHKDLLAIEMEAFSLMFASQITPHPRPRGIVAKAVSDAGDNTKSDHYQAYAAYTSARVFEEFAIRYLSNAEPDVP